MAGTIVQRTWVRRMLMATALAAVVVGMMWGFQRRLIYFPAGSPPPVDEVLPDASAVTFTTTDGLQLSAWYVPAGPVAVMVLPGNGGNRAGRAPLGRALADAGLSVLLVDYRGYGGNPGRPSEAGLAADARAALSWLRSREHVRDVVVFGESIGAAVAVRLAVEQQPPAALVLRSPFTSLGDVARLHYGPVPDRLLRDRFPARRRIGELTTPLLVVAGTADTIVPIHLSRRLFATAPQPKRFVEVDGAEHNDPRLAYGEEVVDAVVRFLDDHGLLSGD